MPDWSDALLEYLAARGRGPGISQNRTSSSPQAGRVTGPAVLAIRLLSQTWVRPDLSACVKHLASSTMLHKELA
jgi:hypothetical protein